MKHILICTLKSWNIEKANELKMLRQGDCNISIITNNKNLEQRIIDINPDYIFFPHWSYIIPKEVYENFNCIVFHMTDLPYGRGGSPLQNLIVRGYKQTKISAIKVTGEIDAGPVYMKKELSLEGSAEEIYKRASEIIFNDMIPYIIANDIEPKEQEGTPVVFKRRKPAESQLQESFSMEQIYDYIRMLDAEGYPQAFIQLGDKKFEFSKVTRATDKLIAQVVIREGKNE